MKKAYCLLFVYALTLLAAGLTVNGHHLSAAFVLAGCLILLALAASACHGLWPGFLCPFLTVLAAITANFNILRANLTAAVLYLAIMAVQTAAAGLLTGLPRRKRQRLAGFMLAAGSGLAASALAAHLLLAGCTGTGLISEGWLAISAVSIMPVSAALTVLFPKAASITAYIVKTS